MPVPPPSPSAPLVTISTTEVLYCSISELSGGSALAHPDNATTVRVRNGVPATTDGPFAEAKEQLAGYYIVDVADIDEAISWAAKMPRTGASKESRLSSSR